MRSKYRTAVQEAKIKSAEGAGYKWERDSDYSLKLGRGRSARHAKFGCISVLNGNVTGSERSMIIYPDGSVETKAFKLGSVTFSRSKLSNALSSHGLLPGECADEDAHFGA